MYGDPNDDETPELTTIQEALARLARARGWELPTPEELAQASAARRARGPAYADCHCDGEGGSGDRLAVALERDADGIPTIPAMINGALVQTWARICTCPDGDAFRVRLAEQRAAAADELRQKRVQRILGVSGLSQLAQKQHWTVDTWRARALAAEASTAAVDQIMDVVADWRTAVEQETGRSVLLLSGPWGVGKSGLAEALVTQAVEALRMAVYRAAPEISNELRVAYDRSGRFGTETDVPAPPAWDAVIRAYQEADLLAIDDLGTEAMTGVYEERIREWLVLIIDGRIRALRPTIITTNRTRSEIASRYGERLAERLGSHYTHQAWFAVPSLRGFRADS